ncbi:hypothetical protein ACEU6E_10765 (plasmid) [Halorutilales archaeon Cl-col2-1]
MQESTDLQRIHCKHCGESPRLHRDADDRDCLVARCDCDSPRRLQIYDAGVPPKSWRVE